MPNPTTNADNLPPIPLTEEQRFLFDTRGWLLFPGILSETEVKEMRAFCYQLNRNPNQSLNPTALPSAVPLNR